MEKFFSLQAEGTSKPMVIVLGGSGKLADFLSHIYAPLQGSDTSQISEKLTDRALDEYSKMQKFSNAIKDIKDVFKSDMDWKAMFRKFLTEKEDQVNRWHSLYDQLL